MVDGALQQSGTAATGVNGLPAGDKAWVDYTGDPGQGAEDAPARRGFRSVSARRMGRILRASPTWAVWGNTKSGFGITLNNNFTAIGDSTAMSVADNRWYEVKVEVSGNDATGYVDGKKVATAKLVPVAAVAGGGGRGFGGGGAGGMPGGGGGGMVPQMVQEPQAPPLASAPISGYTVIAGVLGAMALVVGLLWLQSRLGRKKA